MAELPIVITDQGRAEHINAENTGTEKLKIVEVRLGSGQYEVGEGTKSQTALQEEFKPIETIAGEVVADDTIHVSILDEGDDVYSVGEFGLYTESGTLYAVYSQPAEQGWIIEKAAPSTLLLAVDIILDSLDANVLEFGDLTILNPPASETIAGVLRLASSQHVVDGDSHDRAVTPAGLKHRYGQVDNTPDAQKPVSAPQQSALDQKADKGGDYQSLRARGTTKEDVGLSEVDNYSREHYDSRYGLKGDDPDQHRTNSQNDARFTPIGMTYIQFPGYDDPSELFGGSWTDVSSEFNSAFFRADGSNSAGFGSLQQHQMQRITGSTNSNTRIGSDGATLGGNGAINVTSGNSISRGNGSNDGVRIHFNSANSPNSNASSSTNGETRPTNYAIRIWEKVAH